MSTNKAVKKTTGGIPDGGVSRSANAMKHIFDACILHVIEQILQNFRVMPIDQHRAALEVAIRYITSGAKTLDKGQFVQLVEDSKYDIEAHTGGCDDFSTTVDFGG